MDLPFRLIQDATSIPTSTLTLILLMCGVAMYFVTQFLVIPAMIVVLYPMVVGLAVGANVALTKLEYFVLNKYDQWLICTIVSATIGVIIGLVIAVCLARGLEYRQARQQISQA